MNFLKKHSKLILIATLALITFILSYVSLELKLDETPAWTNGILENNHQLLMKFEYTNNEQSRLLQFLIPELFTKSFGLSIMKAYMLQRILFVWGTLLLFFFFLQKWFTPMGSSICLLFFWLIQNSTFANDLQESSPLLALTFLLGLWSIRDQKPIPFMFVLFVGGINNETILFLPAVYFFYNFESKNLLQNWKLIFKTVGLSVPAYAAVGIIRYVNRNQPHLGGAWHWQENMDNINKLYELLDFYWFLPMLFIFLLPKFLQRAYLAIPLFILPHLITGIIEETRQMVPILFIMIPAALASLFLLAEKIKSIYKARFSA